MCVTISGDVFKPVCLGRLLNSKEAEAGRRDKGSQDVDHWWLVDLPMRLRDGFFFNLAGQASFSHLMQSYQ